MDKSMYMVKFFLLISFLITLSFFTHSKELEILNDEPGEGVSIVNHSKIKVHYKGFLENGTVFDSSYKRKKPFQFQIGTKQVIEGWEIGLIGMKLGGKRTFIVPPELAYGKKGAGSIIPPNSKLIFEIEIIDVKPPSYKLIKAIELKKKQEKGFVVIDIRSKKEWEETGTIPGSLKMTAFDKNGKFLKDFLKSFQSSFTTSDHIIFVSDNGDISSILANGFVEQLGAKNMYSLEGGIKSYFKIK